MKNKFKMFNDTKIDESDYGDFNLSEKEKEKIKYRMISKINKDKKNYKKYITVASASLVIIGCMAFTNESTLAYIELIGERIEKFLGRDTQEFKGYKVSINETKEVGGLKINLSELMLDDGQMILSLNLDYSNFDLKKLGIDKDSLIPKISAIEVNDLVYIGAACSTSNKKVKGENQINYLIKYSLTDIDTDGDKIGDTPYEVLDNIEENKDYKIKVNFKTLSYNTKNNIGNIVGNGGSDKGDSYYVGEYPLNLTFETTLNGKNIMANTTVKKLNKKININEDNVKGLLTIEEVRISPVSVKIKYNFNGEHESNMSAVSVMVVDEKGNNLFSSATGTGEGDMSYTRAEYELNGDEKKIIITPTVYDEKENKELKNQSIEINLK
ncbi:MAG: DUF4179 domain-containing protein [Peptostreptococcaceae bacterium]|nr:DUF4179 domain-containing protein [Peptostreptococcaceae bacterium]